MPPYLTGPAQPPPRTPNPFPTLAPAPLLPCLCSRRSSLPHPPQPTLASSGVWVALLWLLATSLSAEQAGMSGFLGGGGRRKERRAGFPSWNHLETSYLGSEPFPSTWQWVCRRRPPSTPHTQSLPFPGAWLGGWERLVLTKQLYFKALLRDAHTWQPGLYIPVKDVKKETKHHCLLSPVFQKERENH